MVQCRQAATALYSLLTEWTSFVLIDNHTYLKFLYKDNCECPPSWFCVVRISIKFLCALVTVGFTTGTPGVIQHQVCDELKSELSALTYLSSPVKTKESACCTLLRKPLERILIRYERIPTDFTTVVFPDGTQPPQISQAPMLAPFTGTFFTTLSRYLYHKRWIWSTSDQFSFRLGESAIARIISTLTRWPTLKAH